jgi:hypothetical protein
MSGKLRFRAALDVELRKLLGAAGIEHHGFGFARHADELYFRDAPLPTKLADRLHVGPEGVVVDEPVRDLIG